jgi:hypothetical protein
MRCTPCEWKERHAATIGTFTSGDASKSQGTQRDMEAVHEDPTRWSARLTRVSRTSRIGTCDGLRTAHKDAVRRVMSLALKPRVLPPTSCRLSPHVALPPLPICATSRAHSTVDRHHCPLPHFPSTPTHRHPSLCSLAQCRSSLPSVLNV